MDFEIGLLLAQDGVTNGAIYALLALALVLVFAVTRVIFIPQGEFVAYGALTLASVQAGKLPGTLWLLLALSVIAALLDTFGAWRRKETGRGGRLAHLARIVAGNLAVPVVVAAILGSVATDKLAQPLQVVLALLVTVPLGPLLYRLVFQPVANESNLFLLILAVAVHMVLLACGLYFFGAEGSRTSAFSDGSLELGGLVVQGQTVWVIASTGILIAALFFFFERTLYGKALRATAINRIGARLMGIPTELAGKISFGLAAFIGAFSGVLASPLTTIYYDTGFLIGLKGFVAAIVGGLVSYPVAALGALLVGGLESFASFWASSFKEAIVFALIIPVLLWRSLTTHTSHDE
jgi:branched-chain amino acid transport system permease protein